MVEAVEGQKKKEKKCPKAGRNRSRCTAYKMSQTREFNKARRLKKYLKKWPMQKDAWAALDKLEKILYTEQRKRLGLADFIDRYQP